MNPENDPNPISISSATTIDNALLEIGFGKFNYILIFLTGMSLACVFMELICINIVLPIAQCDLNLSTTDKSWLSCIGLVGITCSSHFWGFLADSRGRKTAIAVPLLFAAAFSMLASLATSFWMLLICRFLNGFL